MYSNKFLLLLFLLLCFLNNFSIYNTLFTDTISNIPLTIDIAFSVFLGYDKQLLGVDISLQLDSDKLRSCVALHQDSYICQTANKSHN